MTNIPDPAQLEGLSLAKPLAKLHAEHTAATAKLRGIRRANESYSHRRVIAQDADVAEAAAARRLGAKDPGDPRTTAVDREHEERQREWRIVSEARSQTEAEAVSLIRKTPDFPAELEARRAIERRRAVAAFDEAAAAMRRIAELNALENWHRSGGEREALAGGFRLRVGEREVFAADVMASLRAIVEGATDSTSGKAAA